MSMFTSANWKRGAVVLATTMLAVVAPGTAFAAAPSTNQSSPAMTKAAFVGNLLALLNVQPDPAGPSPFKDLPANSWYWGFVHKALELHLVAPVSATVFGSSQPVTESEAVALASAVLKGAGSTSAVESVFSPYNPSGDVTLYDQLLLARKVAELSGTIPSGVLGYGASAGAGASGGSTTPGGTSASGGSGASGSSTGGSSASSAAGKTLLQAIANGTSVTDMQGQASMQLTMGADLTAAGQKDKTLQAALAFLEHGLSTKMTFSEAQVNGQRRALITTQVTPSASSGLAPSGPQTIQEFLLGTHLYMNVGSGWQPLPGSQQFATLLKNATGGVGLALNTIQISSSTALSGGGYSYVGSLNGQGLAALTKTLLANSQLPGVSASSASQAGMQALLQQIFTHMQSSLALTVSPVNGQPLVTNETVHIAIQVPASLLAAAAPSSQKATLLKEMTALNLTESMQMSFTYNTASVAVPTGLPGA